MRPASKAQRSAWPLSNLAWHAPLTASEYPLAISNPILRPACSLHRIPVSPVAPLILDLGLTMDIREILRVALRWTMAWAVAGLVALASHRAGLPAPLPLLRGTFSGAALGAWVELRGPRA